MTTDPMEKAVQIATRARSIFAHVDAINQDLTELRPLMGLQAEVSVKVDEDGGLKLKMSLWEVQKLQRTPVATASGA